MFASFILCTHHFITLPFTSSFLFHLSSSHTTPLPPTIISTLQPSTYDYQFLFSHSLLLYWFLFSLSPLQICLHCHQVTSPAHSQIGTSRWSSSSTIIIVNFLFNLCFNYSFYSCASLNIVIIKSCFINNILMTSHPLLGEYQFLSSHFLLFCWCFFFSPLQVCLPCQQVTFSKSDLQVETIAGETLRH